MRIPNLLDNAPDGTASILVITGRATALFSSCLLAIILVSLISENQRKSLSCRLAGSSADACRVAIHGPQSF
jgi:hypothetical protein